MRSSSLSLLALTVLVGLSGCQAVAPAATPVAPQAAAAPSQPAAAVSQPGPVTVSAHLRVNDAKNRRLMAEIAPWVIADIHHVKVSVMVTGSTSVLRSVVVPFADLGQMVEIGGLNYNTNYTLKTRAYNDEAETVAIDDSVRNPDTCTTEFMTGATLQTAIDAIALKLVDKALSADGANTVDITEGVMILPTASEAITILEPTAQ